VQQKIEDEDEDEFEDDFRNMAKTLPPFSYNLRNLRF
jgi:hypothetical protein